MYEENIVADMKPGQGLPERTDMRILRQLMVTKRIEKIRTHETRAKGGRVNVSGKVREAGLVWLGHVDGNTETEAR